MISNCGHDENNKYSGGAAGDQTGGEWVVRKWYYGNWTHVLRHPSEDVRDLIADLHTKAAKNDNIGYDQSNRLSYWNCLAAALYAPSKIKTKCEADCSSGVAANVRAAGYILNIDELKKVDTCMTTRSEVSILKAAGFEVLTDSKYLLGEDYLIPGDILLREGHHTTVNLSYGSKANTKGGTHMFEVKTVKMGTTGASTLLCQEILKAKGFTGRDNKELILDGDCGGNTVFAINEYQCKRRKEGFELGNKGACDGTCGPNMWKDLLSL